jgi:hypothetical protein
LGQAALETSGRAPAVAALISSQQGGEALQAGSAVRRAADEAKNETLEALGWLMLFAGCDRAREPLAEFGIHRDQPLARPAALLAVAGLRRTTCNFARAVRQRLTASAIHGYAGHGKAGS